MRKITILFSVLALAFNIVEAQTPTIFDFDTNAVENVSNVTEEIGGLTVTVTNDSGVDYAASLKGWGDAVGSSGDVVTNALSDVVTFTFDQPVVVNSIHAIEGEALASETFTFTPDGDASRAVSETLTGGTKTVDLNWVNVTYFTVTKTGGLLTFDDLSVYPISSQTIFDFDTNAVENVSNVTEEIGGLTVTVTNDSGVDYAASLKGWGDAVGSSGDVVTNALSDVVTFTFDQPVVVNSIHAIEGEALASETFTFTPDGDASRAVSETLTGGTKTVDLNWVNVTYFTVTKTGGLLTFDDLSVHALETLGVREYFKPQRAIVYPNPVQNNLHIKSISDIRSINVYNGLGQKVLQSKQEIIDMSHFSKGLYFLQIHTESGIETKRIIKK